MKRSAILEKHAACIGTMFLHKSEHTFNSKCEATAAALEDVKTHLTHQNLSLVNISYFLVNLIFLCTHVNVLILNLLVHLIRNKLEDFQALQA